MHFTHGNSPWQFSPELAHCLRLLTQKPPTDFTGCRPMNALQTAPRRRAKMADGEDYKEGENESRVAARKRLTPRLRLESNMQVIVTTAVDNLPKRLFLQSHNGPLTVPHLLWTCSIPNRIGAALRRCHAGHSSAQVAWFRP
jgi:hypothetical protein